MSSYTQNKSRSRGEASLLNKSTLANGLSVDIEIGNGVTVCNDNKMYYGHEFKRHRLCCTKR